MVNNHKTDWHHMVFLALWAYHTTIKASTRFTTFQLVYGVKFVLPIKCEIPTLHSTIELLSNTTPLEERLAQIEHNDRISQQPLYHNEAHKNQTKASFDYNVIPQSFTEDEFFLCYIVSNEALACLGKFETLWKGPYIIKHCLLKGAYISVWDLPQIYR